MAVDKNSTFGYHLRMDIKTDLEIFLTETGWNIPKLVTESGANKDSLYRLMNGERQGISYKTMHAIWPYLYGDLRPPAQDPPEEAA